MFTYSLHEVIAQGLCESGGAVLGFTSLIVLTVSVDVKQHLKKKAQELCESRGGRPGLPVPNSPYGLCGREATFEEEGTGAV